VVEETITKPIAPPHIITFGDYSSYIAFVLYQAFAVKGVHIKPNVIAEEFASELDKHKTAKITKIEALNGYINFFLSDDFLKNELAKIYKDKDSYGRSKIGKGRKIVIDYSAPNIAKPMHVGHLRSTIIGDALANIYEALGYKVIRWNYLGDWGTQFGNLIAAYRLWGDKGEVEKNPIKTLEALYVRFHEEMKAKPELERAGQEEFQKLEGGDRENRKLWEWFKKESLKEFEKMYKLLGVEFDTYIGESAYEEELAPTVADLQKRDIAERGEGGSVIVNLDKYGLPPALIQKSDGVSLYLTRDIASLKDRIAKYRPEKILYVVASQQDLYFRQLFRVAEMMGLNGVGLKHVNFGLVLGEDRKKLSTREGKTVALDEVLEKTINLAREIVEKKSAERGAALSEKEKEEIAQTVAVGALKYQDLKEHRNSDIVFDWQRMLDFTGNSGPYLQYTYARLASIKRKAGETGGKPDFNLLTEKAETSVIKQLLEFPDVIKKAGETNLTNHLALYLYELANLANRFYETVPVIKDGNATRRAARLALVETAAAILKTGLGLLGVRALEKI
jgi:arginyl-tRNA synthetase